ncbi:MAG: DNA-deoxyinosine glycosylase [Bacteroidia bacterium]
MKIESFGHIADNNSKILILGTMPGKDSLKAGEYYGHHNNLFWDIMFRVCIPEWKCDEVVIADYKTKKSLLITNNIALWDVLKFCDRKESSLDKDIRNQIHNDFKTFFQDYPTIKVVFFTSKNAAKYFEEFRPEPLIFDDRIFITLQSTSPMNKTNSFKILNDWMQIRRYFNN